MGTWGYGIFEDDFTLDIQDYYRQFRKEEIPVKQIEARICRIYSDIINDTDLEPLFYIGLAATMIMFGELTDSIKANAIRHIDQGNGLELWREAGLIPLLRRKLALNHFKKKLLKATCILDTGTIDEEDLMEDRFDPQNQRYFVYEITFSSGKKLIGNTAHKEQRAMYFEQNPLK
ncbi:hypothetical protein ACFFK0_06040 [Paenibacillus chartarius]|uniref:DUF4259 domain-containing protein n=1 Tax=Paenibacillus chartarius TaxID=747481 RepID=A0ABV6DHA2_9BACL